MHLQLFSLGTIVRRVYVVSLPSHACFHVHAEVWGLKNRLALRTFARGAKRGVTQAYEGPTVGLRGHLKSINENAITNCVDMSRKPTVDASQTHSQDV